MCEVGADHAFAGYIQKAHRPRIAHSQQRHGGSWFEIFCLGRTTLLRARVPVHFGVWCL